MEKMKRAEAEEVSASDNVVAKKPLVNRINYPLQCAQSAALTSRRVKSGVKERECGLAFPDILRDDFSRKL